MSATQEDVRREALPLRVLAAIGAPVRRAGQLVLATAALSLGVATEALSRRTWRRATVRDEFRRELRLSLLGGLLTVLVTATIVGVGMVFQAISWLSYVGQQAYVGTVLVNVLVREVTPIFVGLILLGRSGTVTVVEFGAIKASGQLRMLEAQGLDPFTLLVLPRVLALALTAFTLGVFFLLTALGTGWLTAQLLALPTSSTSGVGTLVVAATDRRDFALFAVKLASIGVLVGLICAITGMSATRRDTPSYLLPRAFVRGTFAVLLTSVVLTVAIT